jgi:hypothetical protein
MDVTARISDLWSDINPVAGYTGGHLSSLTKLFFQTADSLHDMRSRIEVLRRELKQIPDVDLRGTADAILTTLKTQLELARPSGTGPSGTGAGGVYAAADGVFYIVLKSDFDKDWVPGFLDEVQKMVEFETRRWWGQDFTILVRKECLNTVIYMRGTLAALLEARHTSPPIKDKVNHISAALAKYEALFTVPGLDSDDFKTYWPIFQSWDRVSGPASANGYPACLKNYYQIPQSAEDIGVVAQGWLDLDLPVTIGIAEQIEGLPFMRGQAMGSLQSVWDAVSKQYNKNFDPAVMKAVLKACNDFGAKYVIAFTPEDHVKFDATPAYLVNLVTGGEDFAVNYLDPKTAYSQLYLTASKNTSLLTMINILVHEASHGFNFVLSARHASSPLLNVNTSLEVPMTEGMAFYREYQYWQAAQELIGRTDLDLVQTSYLALYGSDPAEQAQGVLCAQLETYIWRVIRYVRALCDVRVNGGEMTYTDFIAWAAGATGLSDETLHGECFTFMASPGYAPCYAVGGASYATLQKRGIPAGVSEIDFNTGASRQGFFAWPTAIQKMEAMIAPAKGGAR